MFLNLRIKLINFYKQHKSKLFILFIVIVLIISLNIYLGVLKDKQPPSVSYNPHTPIISGNKVTSKKTQESIEDAIKTYMEKCNSKQYEDAFELISEDCRKFKFSNDIEQYKKYIDYIFDGDKTYSIQNYSNRDNVYVYKVTIGEDLMATGLNTDKSNITYDEMIVLTKEKEEMKLAVDGFVYNEMEEIIAEDEFMKISINGKTIYYDKVVYDVQIKNKTTYAILLAKDTEKETIGITLKNGDNREIVLKDYQNNEKVIRGKESKDFKFEFVKYYDEESDINSLVLNKIRILEEYSGMTEQWEEEEKTLVKSYSTTINIK